MISAVAHSCCSNSIDLRCVVQVRQHAAQLLLASLAREATYGEQKMAICRLASNCRGYLDRWRAKEVRSCRWCDEDWQPWAHPAGTLYPRNWPNIQPKVRTLSKKKPITLKENVQVLKNKMRDSALCKVHSSDWALRFGFSSWKWRRSSRLWIAFCKLFYKMQMVQQEHWKKSKALWRGPVVYCCGGLAAQEANSWDPGSIPGRDIFFDVPESSCLLSGPWLQLDSRHKWGESRKRNQKNATFSSLSAPIKREELIAGSDEKKHSAVPVGLRCFFVWSGCQFVYLCRSWKRREFD